jgi:hypothetical protein
MMDRLEIQRLLALPANEKLELAQMLWRSVKPVEDARFLHDGLLARMNRGREDEEPWEDVRAEL